MNGKEMLLSFAETNEDYVAAAGDAAEVKRSFRQYKERRRRLTAAVCCCAAVLLAAGFGARGLYHKLPSGTEFAEDRVDPTTGTVPESGGAAAQTDERTTVGTGTAGGQETVTEDKQEPATGMQEPATGMQEQTTVDAATVEWNGKRVTYALEAALQQEGAGTLTVVAAPYPDETATYQGTTLAAYEAAAEEENALPEKLWQLLKEGDALKYGDALYQTGTPEGEKWAEELYKERVAFYGEELLNKYIVDGEFLAAQVETDIADAQAQHAAQDACRQAYAACAQAMADEAAALWTAQGIDCEPGNGNVTLNVTPAAFAALEAPAGEWYYSLPEQGGDTATQS